MRRLVLALFGLAMAAPAVALAQSSDCKDCNKGYVVQPTQMPNGFRPPRLCADCYKKYKQTGVWPGQNPPPGYAPAAPGYAPQMAGAEYGPGYAMTSEPTSPYDPTPVGVMRTNYRTGMGMPANPTGAGMAPGYAVTGMPAAHSPVPASWGPESSLLAGPKTNDRNMMASMLGLNWWQRMAAQRDFRRSTQHAREAYGAPPSADSLPQWMVTGR